MTFAYAVLALLCLSGLAIRTAYEVRKKAGRVDTRNRAVFAAVFAAMCVMLASWPIMCPRDPWRIAVPGAVRWCAHGALIAALALEIGALLQLRALENIDHLVTTGLFSRLRHPMYAGFLLWIGGWVLRCGAGVSGVLGLVCVGNILYWRWLEERALEVRFGEPYRRYRASTWC